MVLPPQRGGYSARSRRALRALLRVRWYGFAVSAIHFNVGCVRCGSGAAAWPRPLAGGAADGAGSRRQAHGGHERAWGSAARRTPSRSSPGRRSCRNCVLMQQGPALLAGHMDVAPVHDRHDDGIEIEPLLRQAIFVAQGPFLVGHLGQDEILDQLAQPAGQDRPRARRDAPGIPRSAARAGNSRAGSAASSGRRSPTRCAPPSTPRLRACSTA